VELADLSLSLLDSSLLSGLWQSWLHAGGSVQCVVSGNGEFGEVGSVVRSRGGGLDGGGGTNSVVTDVLVQTNAHNRSWLTDRCVTSRFSD